MSSLEKLLDSNWNVLYFLYSCAGEKFTITYAGILFSKVFNQCAGDRGKENSRGMGERGKSWEVRDISCGGRRSITF
jgi:hypothetical protein